MKKSVIIETIIAVELTAQDVLAYVQEKNLVPKDWQFYSVEVTGNGISNGAKLTIKNSQSKST